MPWRYAEPGELRAGARGGTSPSGEIPKQRAVELVRAEFERLEYPWHEPVKVRGAPEP